MFQRNNCLQRILYSYIGTYFKNSQKLKELSTFCFFFNCTLSFINFPGKYFDNEIKKKVDNNKHTTANSLQLKIFSKILLKI